MDERVHDRVLCGWVRAAFGAIPPVAMRRQFEHRSSSDDSETYLDRKLGRVLAMA